MLCSGRFILVESVSQSITCRFCRMEMVIKIKDFPATFGSNVAIQLETLGFFYFCNVDAHFVGSTTYLFDDLFGQD